MSIGYKVPTQPSNSYGNNFPYSIGTSTPRGIIDQELSSSVTFIWYDTNILANLSFGSSSGIRERTTYIYNIIDFRYALIKPIPVKLIYIDNEVIGEISELELYSFGNNDFEVLKELNEDISDLFETLVNEDSSKLGKYPKAWLSILNEYFELS